MGQATCHQRPVAMLHLVMRGLLPGIISVLSRQAAWGMPADPCFLMMAASWR